MGNSSVLGEQHFQGRLSQASRTEKRTWDFIAGKAWAASMDETVSASYRRKDTGTKALHTPEEPCPQLLDSLSLSLLAIFWHFQPSQHPQWALQHSNVLCVSPSLSTFQSTASLSLCGCSARDLLVSG